MASEDETRRDASVLRHEEEAHVDVTVEPYAAVRARKRVDVERVAHVEPRAVEYAESERTPPNENDSGEVEVLPDGSLSIPLLEERLVVRKETVVRERIVVRKRTVTEHERLEVDLRRERVEIEGVDPPPGG
jgi:uncharacterized protein (TIGR02271 family)